MSHFTRIKTVMKEMDVLETAITCVLGWDTRRDGVVRGYRGNTVKAQLVAVNPNAQYDVGFERAEDESFSLVTDYYGLRDLPFPSEELPGKISQAYSLEVVKQEAEQLGLSMTDIVTNEDGSLQLQLVGLRW